MRYRVEFDDYGFNIIDTTVPDGENCLVDGAMNRAEAEAKCAEWNAAEPECTYENHGEFAPFCTCGRK